MLHGYTEGCVNVGAYVPPHVKRELVELAHGNRRPVSEEIRVALRRHLECERSVVPDLGSRSRATTNQLTA